MGKKKRTKREGRNTSSSTAFSESEKRESSDGTKVESKLGGTVDVGAKGIGVDANTNRVDRLRLLGNGVVPQTAAKAFSTLSMRLVDHLKP